MSKRKARQVKQTRGQRMADAFCVHLRSCLPSGKCTYSHEGGWVFCPVGEKLFNRTPQKYTSPILADIPFPASLVDALNEEDPA